MIRKKRSNLPAVGVCLMCSSCTKLWLPKCLKVICHIFLTVRIFNIFIIIKGWDTKIHSYGGLWPEHPHSLTFCTCPLVFSWSWLAFSSSTWHSNICSRTLTIDNCMFTYSLCTGKLTLGRSQGSIEARAENVSPDEASQPSFTMLYACNRTRAKYQFKRLD